MKNVIKRRRGAATPEYRADGGSKPSTPSNKQSSPKPTSRPQRFILLIRFSDVDEFPHRIGWRVLVRKTDVSLVKHNARQGIVIDDDLVRSWFTRYAKGWPTPLRGNTLNHFLRALNALRVTQDHTVVETRKVNIESKGIHLEPIKHAFALLDDKMPELIARARMSPNTSLTEHDIQTLDDLAKALHAARGIFKPITAPPRETVWHMDACLIEWHLRNLLSEAGHSDPVGYAANSPLARVVVAALEAIGVAVEPGAVAKSLKDYSSKNARLMSEAQVSAWRSHSIIA